MKFGLVGDGNIAKYHKVAIEHVGGKLIAIEDPKYGEESASILENKDPLMCVDTFLLMQSLDYIVICSPTFLHRQHILQALKNPNIKIIVEKPMVLPWEPLADLDNDRINIVLQLRYAYNLPKKADLISVQFIRDETYFKSWKGDAKKTGGLFHNLFIHYLDLAHLLDADLEGRILTEGVQYRNIFKDDEFVLDLMDIDIQHCYNLLYEDIIKGNGIKPSDIFYLDWTLKRNS
ncbi:MAG: Gfo/Idh/MocA family oxidoreductase, partial [Candidatus Heimdallarchaeota archaeon]|nr:Gfo/Idh/MocA family oxidoreductase [Candidatus Heimdallarchaeota archaeon]